MIVSATVTYDSSEEEDVRVGRTRVGRRLHPRKEIADQLLVVVAATAPLVGRRLQEIAGLDPTAPLIAS